MRLLEYESKEILKKHRIPVPGGQIVSSPEDVIFDKPVMVKAQVPIGGRGKAGGVMGASSAAEAKACVERILLTSVRGYRAKRVLLEQKADVFREFYMAVTYDTVAKSPVAVFSAHGGVDIEELAQREPDKIIKRRFSVGTALPQYASREVISEAGVTGRLLLGLGSIFSTLADIFLNYDATIAEINPMGLTEEGNLLALDCHMELDDDALFRHKDLAEIQKDETRIQGGRTPTEFERRAAEIDEIDHRGVAGRMIEFDGTLGLIIGGGGASLTAFDAVRAHGGRPANYCEIGGNPTVQKVKELTRHILSKPHIKKIAVIMNVVSNTRVDLVARGIVKGIIEADKVPSETVAVFRVPGAWEDEGFKILKKYGVAYCDRSVSIDKAAKIAVESTLSA
jgi:succinyl-CoA synthetase beta subunit/citryl-CoA synthetase large subunit